MNRYSLITAGLIAVGLVSAASANTTVFCTGSTAFRAVTYTACKLPGAVFASAASGAPADPKVVSATDASSANTIVFEGYEKNADGTYTLYDLDCNWTGSEAGVAAVAGVTTLPNDTPADPDGLATHEMPNVPSGYLQPPVPPATVWTVMGAAGANVTDIAFSDTSQAVSLTPVVPGTGSDLVHYGSGIVGIVTFEWMKNKNSAPATPSWGHITGVTHASAQVAMSGPQVPRLFTGNSSSIDPDTDTVVVCGRNKGSGTHANQLLDLAIGIKEQVDQWTVFSTYHTGGVLTFDGPIAPYTDTDMTANPPNVNDVGNDGFDSGGSVAKVLQCDGKGSSYIFIGFLGIPDAIGLPGVPAGSAAAGGAIALTLDGITESNAGVENGYYTAWGHEHVYGKHGQLSTDPGGIIAQALTSGVPTALVSLTWGTVAANQDPGIPVSLMHADKAGDVGFPGTTEP